MITIITRDLNKIGKYTKEMRDAKDNMLFVQNLSTYNKSLVVADSRYIAELAVKAGRASLANDIEQKTLDANNKIHEKYRRNSEGAK